jgi:hypothetical protein
MNSFDSQTYKYGDVHFNLSAIAIPSLLDIERAAIIDPDVSEEPRLGDTYLASAVDRPVALSNRV